MAPGPLKGVALSGKPTYGPGDLDDYLVARALAQEDTAAFGELVRRHQSRVRLFLGRLCRNPAQADDLAQDCFLHAWEKLPGFRGQGSFIGWLLRIAWTTFLQSKRQSDRYRAVLDSAARTAGPHHVNTTAAEQSDLDRLLAVLTQEERRIMILSYACGLSHREISDATDMPVGTVKSIIHRGKLKIRETFEIADHQYG
ncbi:MAG TPA: sigma-70 family RNA polymerase sigma factor [Woeseiaceae bacterium]|nr:sigma-70 family RNA polymerase sigma factor [Woeseiaceae bacterium]